MTPLLTNLREPPTVGRFYMVPVIRTYPYNGRVDTWPVIGALHEDAEFFGFRELHYHVDARFLTKAQEQAATNGRWGGSRPSIEAVVGGRPLMSRGWALPKGRPVLARKRCVRASYGYAHAAQLPVQNLNRSYGAIAAALHLADGRKLCPHRKVDLSQFPADEHGIVTCPLHGLRVCVSDRIAA